MKPLKISIQAFGPYLNKTEIDFTPLYSNGLFLIAGPTGCGKTTILDAMSFALYGQASGDIRDVRDMRTISAPDELETFVSFELKLGEEIYRFERGIKIRIVKKRDKTTEKMADNEANCYQLVAQKWQLLCSSTDVAKKAEELLGFSHQQFSQVVVLPQGEFRRLLTASSQDKQKILEKLFGTQRWQNFTDRLSIKSKEIKNELLKCEERKNALCESAKCESYEEVEKNSLETEKELTAAKELEKKLRDEYKQTENALKEAEAKDKKFAEFDKAEKEFLALNNKKPEMEEARKTFELSQKASAMLPYLSTFENAENAQILAKKDYESSEQNFKAAKIERETAQKDSKAAEELAPKLDVLSKEAARLSMFYTLAVSLAKVTKELETEKVSLKKSIADCETSKKALKTHEENTKNLKTEINEITKNYVSKYPELLKKQTALQTLVKNYDDLLKLKEDVINSHELLKKKAEEYNEVKLNLENAKEKLENLKTLFDSDSAYKLSQNLKDECECPVCGSKTHPKLALPCNGAPSKEQIEEQKKHCEKLEKKFDTVSTEGKNLRIEYNNAKKNYDELKAECEKSEISEEDARKELLVSDANVKLANDAFEKQKKLQKELEIEEENLKNSDEKVKSLEENRNKLVSKTAQLEGKSAEILNSLPKEFNDAETIEKKIVQSKAEHDSLSKKIEASRSRFENANNALTAASERKTAAEKALESAIKTRTAAKEEFELKLFAELPKEPLKIRALALSEEKLNAVKKALSDFDNSFLVTSNSLLKLKADLENSSRPETAKLLKEKDDAFKRMNAETAEATRLSGKKESLQTLLKSLDDIKKKVDRLSVDYALYSRIYSLSNGTNPKKTPIHQFVLGLMLEDIIVSANGHLSKLSSARYTLVKSEEPSRGGGTKGLELSVDDAWTGGVRPVNTLSGGEMFLASLSLAFGLSDVVQSYSGGIRLDSLFIDEGFGSLDNDSLEISMNALENLRTSGRLVGVISHVSELSDRIHNRINVVKLKDGTANAVVETEN